MSTLHNEYTLTKDTVTPDDVAWGTAFIKQPDPPISTIYVGDTGYTWAIGVNKKFNWFQKKMIKWCFGFEVKENSK